MMTLSILPISKARSRLLELVRDSRQKRQDFILTKDGEAISVIINIDDYNSILPLLQSQRNRNRVKLSQVISNLDSHPASLSFDNESKAMDFWERVND